MSFVVMPVQTMRVAPDPDSNFEMYLRWLEFKLVRSAKNFGIKKLLPKSANVRNDLIVTAC